MGVQARNPFENDDDIGELKTGLPGQRVDDDDDDIVEDDDELDVDAVELREIHHVGIAVADLDEALAGYRDAFGVTVDLRELIDEEDVEIAVLTVGGSRLQLLAPLDDDSWLVEFLDGQASGLNHVGFAVDDVEAALVTLADRGYDLVDTEPRRGPDDSRTAYVHPPDQPGTLIQLVED